MRSLAGAVLVAFLAGGVVAPPAHRALHALERGEARAEHHAAGHHHHEVADRHGVEWTPPCDRRLVLDELACVLCKGLSTTLTESGLFAYVPAADGAAPPPTHPTPAAPAGDALSARGPPHRIA